MQLCCVMYGHKDKSFQAIKRIIVCLMVFVFAGAPVLEALHTHEHPAHIVGHDGHLLSEAQVKCKICDHLVHHQPVIPISVVSFELVRPEGKVVIVQPYESDMLRRLAGLRWTNKGPPSLV